MDVTYTLDPGPVMRFGPPAIEGLERRFGRLLTDGVALEVEQANVTQLANVSSITAAQRTQHYQLVGGCQPT
jgi:hypothetical protein